jgi:hypothetical protein
MGIEIRPFGEAKAAAQAGTMIGKGKRAEEDRARAEREQARAQQIAAQQSARQAALEWEQQKMLLNSQQDFAHEMRMRQAGLEKEARAEEWQTEKMELASRMDFEQDEKERLRVKAEYAAGRDILDKKKDEMPEGEYERALYKFDSIYASKGVVEAVEGLVHKDEDLNIKRRKELEAIVGPELGRAMSLDELEEEAQTMGLSSEDIPGIGGTETTEYTIGQVVDTPQGSMVVVGFDADGEPLVEPSDKKRNEYGGYGATGSF